MTPGESKLRPGITWRSLCATLLCLLLAGMSIQYVHVIQAYGGSPGDQAIPIQAIALVVFLLVLSSLSWLVIRKRLLTRPEMLCVLYAMLIAIPMTGQGMWQRFFGVIAATPREGNFHYIDALSDKLWPHGPNLVEAEFTEEKADELDARGTVEWREVEVETDQFVTLPVLRNESPGQISSLSLRIPVSRATRTCLVPGEPYLVSVLARPVDLGPDSFYFAHLYEDDATTFHEIINDRKPSEVTFVHQRGFLRLGRYGVDVSARVQHGVRLEIGLSGPGELALYDPKFLSVAALENAYRGRRMIGEEAYATLPPSERAGLVVKPDNMWSLSGMKFLVSGYIPLADWTQTAIAWSTPIILLLVGLFAVAVIMRRQWADSERYPFPLARIPCAIIGEPEEDETPIWSAVWRHRIMWIGFAVSLTWALLRMWAFYNPKVPDTSISIPLDQYLSDPAWGGAWSTTFSVSAFLVSICIFFELNVLLSFIVGLILFRALYWVGEFSGLKVYGGYPFRYEQTIGAYLGYAAVVLFFTRKYLWGVVKAACKRGGGARDPRAPISNRTALLIFVFVHVGVVLWTLWLGVPVWGVFAYFCFLMIIGFVSTKLRCECGVPLGYFTPYIAMLFVSLLGGMAVFGASGQIVCLMASLFLTVSVFFFIPGAQLELIEYSRRYRMNPRHVMIAIALGILGGLFVGGWVFLSNAYALGGASIRSQWSFDQARFFGSFQSELSQTTGEFLRLQAGDTMAEGMQPRTWAYIYSGGIAVVLTVLRQFFAGFWFHPIGFVLSSAFFLQWTWGSVLAACVIRATVLKFGGAATVKNKLFPFFIGVFLGSVCFVVLNVGLCAYLQSIGIERVYNGVP